MSVQTAGRFTLRRKLPAGGMGRVFEAEDPQTGRRIALKLLDLGDDVESQQIIKAERLGAELQRQLCAVEERVTRIYELGEMPGYFYIVMEYVEGRDVSEISPGRGLHPVFAARVAQDVLEVLDRAHNFSTNIEGRPGRGVVHGDVKPRNIRVTLQGGVKVLDFGIAKALSATRNFTQNAFASVQYSSPERLATGEVDVSSDLWGVGVVLYEVLTGRPYFEAETGPKLEHIVRNYHQLRPLPVELPEPLKQILARALDPEPRARFRTAAEFASALQRFRTDAPANANHRIGPQEPPDTDATRRVFHDSDPTVRTERAVPFTPVANTRETEATRKTVREPNPFHGTADGGFRPVPVPVSGAKRRKPVVTGLRLLSAAFLLVSLAVGLLTLRQYLVWRSADQLARDLSSEKQQNLDGAWKQYTQLASRSHMPFLLWPAENALSNRFMGDADHTIARSRESDLLPVPESEWERTRMEVAHALELRPNDKTVHGKLRLIDGQLARIHGTARRDSRLLDESRQDFEDAANYMKKSPDPWLGLARLDIYSLHDLNNGEAAIREAERRGHDIGKRETAELADGYLYQGERTRVLGDRASSVADAQRYYGLAGQSLDHARDLYESILPWDGAAASLKKLNEAEARLANRRSAVREP